MANSKRLHDSQFCRYNVAANTNPNSCQDWILLSFTNRRVSAKTPLAQYFLVLPLLFSSFWILYTGFEETMKHFTINFHPSSINERTPFLPRCALEARKGLSALMRFNVASAHSSIQYRPIFSCHLIEVTNSYPHYMKIS